MNSTERLVTTGGLKAVVSRRRGRKVKKFIPRKFKEEEVKTKRAVYQAGRRLKRLNTPINMERRRAR